MKDGEINEFVLRDLELEAGDKVRFYVAGDYATMKEEGSHAKFNAGSEGYYECNTNGRYDFYVKIVGNNLGIYVADHIDLIPESYDLSFASFVVNDGAEVYAWVWGDGFTSHWIHLELVEMEGRYVTTIDVENALNGIKVVRMKPDAAVFPIDGSSSYPDEINTGAWNTWEYQRSTPSQTEMFENCAFTFD